MKSVAETAASESDSDESDSEVDIFHATGRGISVNRNNAKLTFVRYGYGADELRFASPVSLHDQRMEKNCLCMYG